MNNKINNEKIIVSYSWVCAGLACLPIPFWDIVVILPTQILMGTKIANAYGIEVTKQEMKDILLQIFWVIWMWFLSQQIIIRVVYKFIPYLWIVTTIPVVFAFSYAIWKVMDKYFEYKSSWKELSSWEIKDTFHKIYKDMKEKAKKLWKNKILSYWDELKNDEEVKQVINDIKK